MRLNLQSKVRVNERADNQGKGSVLVGRGIFLTFGLRYTHKTISQISFGSYGCLHGRERALLLFFSTELTGSSRTHEILLLIHQPAIVGAFS